jgi:hypothetical protein
MFDVGVGRMEEGWCDDDVEVLEASDTGGAADGWGRGRTCLRRGNRVTGHVRGFLISSSFRFTSGQSRGTGLGTQPEAHLCPDAWC